MLGRANPAGIPGQRLYLFSSNAQPLYARHALNALAMPTGGRTTFRYSSQWINESAKEVWDARLHGQPVLLHFALQQDAHYFEPALFPTRTGRVVKVDREGEYHFVDVELDEYVALKCGGLAQDGTWSPQDLDRAVKTYREFLDAHGVGRPYPSSAALSVDVLKPETSSRVIDVAPTGDPSYKDIECFRRNAVLLQRTESFRNTRFIRFLRLAERGGTDSSVQSKLTGDPPRLRALAGRTYEIEIFSFQPLGVTEPEPFVVSADGVAIQVIGQAGFEIASHYDRIKLAIQPQLPANAKSIQTIMVIEPGPQVDGPRIELPIEVCDRPWVRPGTLIASIVSLGLIVTASAVSPAAWKAALLSAGLLLALGLQWFGRPSIAALAGPAATVLPASQASPTVVVNAAGGSLRGIPTHSQ